LVADLRALNFHLKAIELKMFDQIFMLENFVVVELTCYLRAALEANTLIEEVSLDGNLIP
jgi:hypothetical protein